MLDKILHNKNVHYVKFMRGSAAAWERLKRTPSKISDDTLYFIYTNEQKPKEGKLYLGQRLISGNDSGVVELADIEDVTINDETLIDGDILQFDEVTGEWVNSHLIKGTAITNILPIIFPKFANDGEVLILTEGEQPEVETQEVVLNITSVSLSPAPSEEEEPQEQETQPAEISANLTII